MKILQYWPHFLAHESGPGNAILGWSRALQLLGADVQIGVDPDASNLSPPKDVPCLRIPHRGRGHLRYPIDAGTGLGDSDLVVTHGGWVLWNPVMARIARRLRIPSICMAHGVYNTEVRWRSHTLKATWLWAIERRYLNSCLAVHVFFDDERTQLADLRVVSSPIVVPNGISAPAGFAWDGGSGGYLLWIGRMDLHNKGLDLLLESLAYMPPDERPNLRLHGRDWRAGLETITHIVDRLDLHPWVAVGGPVYGAEKWELMSRAAGFVYPSRWEACPTAVQEAVALGLPTLVTDYPLGRYLAARGGAVLADRTTFGLVSGYRRLLAEDARDVGFRGAQIVGQEMAWDAVAQVWLTRVNALLNAPAE